MGNSRYKNIEPTEFEKVSTYELATRPSKVEVDAFSRGLPDGASFDEFLSSLPDILSVKSLRALSSRINRARERGKPIIWGVGGHVIKTGLAPVLIDLMHHGFLTAVACNGSVLIHDAEIAMAGFTSEDVDATLGEGDFGAARETGELINEAAENSVTQKIGLGESFSNTLVEKSLAYPEFSLFCSLHEKSVPVSVHLTIGADIGHFHPSSDGAALGAGSHYDFRLITSLVREMNGGGVYLNCGSAVTLPEVFLKAITVNRNLGHELTDLTTANLDFLQHYRPLTNVVKRPNANGAGKGFAITGHHEIMIPLLAAAIKSASG